MEKKQDVFKRFDESDWDAFIDSCVVTAWMVIVEGGIKFAGAESEEDPFIAYDGYTVHGMNAAVVIDAKGIQIFVIDSEYRDHSTWSKDFRGISAGKDWFVQAFPESEIRAYHLEGKGFKLL